MSVDLPMKPGLVTVMRRRVPARSSRSNARSRLVPRGATKRRRGQSRPLHVTVIRTPRGALTLSNVTRAPVTVSTPLMRTTGNGRSGLGREAVRCGTAAAGGVAAGAAGTSNGGGPAVSGVGVDVGAGVGAGGVVTAAVGSDRRAADPSGFVTISRTLSTEPRSAGVTV